VTLQAFITLENYVGAVGTETMDRSSNEPIVNNNMESCQVIWQQTPINIISKWQRRQLIRGSSSKFKNESIEAHIY
jgi:hypothetical protein